MGETFFFAGLIILILDRILIYIEADSPSRTLVILTPDRRKKVFYVAVALMVLGALAFGVSLVTKAL